MFMTRRAIFSPGSWQQNLLVAMSMGAAVLLVGCGGGGGGGNSNPPGGTGACGDAVGSGVTVVCGYVTGQAGATNGVNGVTVLLKNSTGATVAQGTTFASSGTNGFYKIVANGNPTQFALDIPSGFLHDYVIYNNATYDQSTTLQHSAGACIPALNITAGQDNRLNTIVIVSDTSAPPPPVFTCPR
jgi:hypothetical protein